MILALLLMMGPAGLSGGVMPNQIQMPQADTVSPVTVSGDRKKKPPPPTEILRMQSTPSGIDQLVAVWPGDAYHEGLDGRVKLRCFIDLHGLAEHCAVAEEVPAGKGFGKAALELRATIRVAPPVGPDGPVAGDKIIAINFQAPDRTVDNGYNGLKAYAGGSVALMNLNNGLAMRKVTMLDNPVWVAAASYNDLARAYPRGAQGQEGYAVDHCAVRRDGHLEGCQTIKEDPAGRGFGNAALELANRFRVDPRLASTPHRDELWLDLPIRFPSAQELAERTVMAPTWVATFDPSKSLKLFPPEAVAAGLTTGRGVARCVVGADGALTGCTPEPGDPQGLGFSKAAARLASTMKMNLWAADGEPVEGGVVHIPIRLNLKAEASPAARPAGSPPPAN